MEDTHGGSDWHPKEVNGIGLNPYCNGRYSWRIQRWENEYHWRVLILIVMEDTHGVQRLSGI